jgi:hypothetical protein
MSEESERPKMRSPFEDVIELSGGYDLLPGVAAKIANAILSEPNQGRDGGEEPRFYRSDKEANRPRKPTAFDGINDLDRP